MPPVHRRIPDPYHTVATNSAAAAERRDSYANARYATSRRRERRGSALVTAVETADQPVPTIFAPCPPFAESTASTFIEVHADGTVMPVRASEEPVFIVGDPTR